MKIQHIPSPAHLIPTKSGEITRFLQGLRLGDVLEAEVLDRIGEGMVKVRLGHRIVTASCPGSLERGAVFRAQVVAPWPDVLLRTVNIGTEHASALQRVLWKALPHLDAEGGKQLWIRAFEELKLLQMGGNQTGQDAVSFWLKHSLGPGSWNLATYLRGCGLLLEPKLAGRVPRHDPDRGPGSDLKALILRILHGQPEKAAGRQAISGLFDLIQGSQSLNLLSRHGETHLYLPLLFYGFQAGDWGDLTIRGHREGKRRRGKSWTITIRMDLCTLGKLIVHMTMKHNVLKCSVLASNPSTRGQVKGGLPTLRGRLAALGFRGVSCRCGTLEDPEEWFKASRVVPEGILEMTV
jgi:hypothetical protein